MKSFLVCTSILILFCCLNCKKTQQEIYTNLKTNYLKESNDINRKKLLDYVIDFSVIKKLGKETVAINKNTLVNIKNKLVVTSKGLELKLKSLPERFFSYYNNKKFFVSDGYKMDLYNMKNELFNTFNLTENQKVTIDDMCAADNRFFYFYKRNLYFSKLDSFNAEKYIDEDFSPPYKKNSFKVKMKVYSNIIIICIGGAGAYNISILDTFNQKIIKKNLSAATNSFFWGNDILYYIGGASGKWELVSFSMKKNEKAIIRSYKNVDNLFFLKRFLVSIVKDKIELYNYEKKETYHFFNDMTLIGLIDNSLLIKYSDLYYLVDYDKFFDQFIKLNNDIPEFYKTNETVKIN